MATMLCAPGLLCTMTLGLPGRCLDMNEPMSRADESVVPPGELPMMIVRVFPSREMEAAAVKLDASNARAAKTAVRNDVARRYDPLTRGCAHSWRRRWVMSLPSIVPIRESALSLQVTIASVSVGASLSKLRGPDPDIGTKFF